MKSLSKTLGISEFTQNVIFMLNAGVSENDIINYIMANKQISEKFAKRRFSDIKWLHGKLTNC